MKIEVNPVDTSFSELFDERCRNRDVFIHSQNIALYSFFPAVKVIRYERHSANEWLIIEYADGGEIRELINGYSLPRIMAKIVEHLR
ncbi:MAG: hypothetical protein ACYCWE_09755 [Eubacteriales bacterium]